MRMVGNIALAVAVAVVVLTDGQAHAQACASTDDVIEAVYQRVLERTRDHPGSDGTVQQLNDGRPTKDIIRAIIVESKEYKDRFVTGRSPEAVVTLLYHHLLARDPDPSGMTTWPAEFRAHGLTAVVDGIMGSQEYGAVAGDWGVPAPKKAQIRACLSYAEKTCGSINPTQAHQYCDATRQHAECHCDTLVASWPKCSCDNGPPPPTSTIVGGAPKPDPIAPDPARCRAGGPDHSTVRIKDSAWARVKVEVKVGNDRERMAPCLSIELHAAKSDDTAAVTTDGEDVCWRRDSDPDHPNGIWSLWTCQMVRKGQTYELGL